jgi:putative DNA primase/helicase
MRKTITAALREGHSIINLDNIEHPLASPDLAKAITQFEYQDRLLGESQMLRLPTNVLWTATGNNLTFRGDLSSRALLCRIDSGLERPEERTFEIPNLMQFLVKNRKKIVTAGLTILRAYHMAGCPHQQVSPWGGFEEWSASIREPLVWAGLPDPCKTRETVLADDPEREDSHVVLLSLRGAFGDDEFTVKQVIDFCQCDAALRVAVLAVAARHNARDRVDPWRLGSWCKQWRDCVVDGLRLRRCSKAPSKIARWQIEAQAGGSGGHQGQEGHSLATESATQPSSNSQGAQNDVRQQKTDPHDPQDPQSSPHPIPAPCPACGEVQPSHLALSEHVRAKHP